MIRRIIESGTEKRGGRGTCVSLRRDGALVMTGGKTKLADVHTATRRRPWLCGPATAASGAVPSFTVTRADKARAFARAGFRERPEKVRAVRAGCPMLAAAGCAVKPAGIIKSGVGNVKAARTCAPF